MSRAKDLMRIIKEGPMQKRIKPEITQSMIEINSSIHDDPFKMLDELYQIQAFLLEQADKLNFAICGGGTHPFHKWILQKIIPTVRYKNLSRQYRYLSKRSTVFGQHIHIGCASGDDAIYLTHALIRYVPQLICISSSSPFYLGTDTGYYSSRNTVFNSFPLSGVIPYLMNWEEFSIYFYKMKNFGIVETMKDFYWDIRPKPEFGTVEVRVCDTPLTIKQSVMIAAYLQSLSLYLLQERPIEISHDLYDVYAYNRFQASRYGFDGVIIDSVNSKQINLYDDMMNTIKFVERYANKLNNMAILTNLSDQIINKKSDSTKLRQILKNAGSFSKVVEEQCSIWQKESQEYKSLHTT
jgi:carboxylate-amine ligase